MKFLKSQARLLTACFLFTIFVIFSCKKETSQTLSPQDEQQANLTASESDAEAEDVFNGVFDDVMGVNTDVGIGGTGLFMRNIAGNYGIANIDSRTGNTNPAPTCLNITIVRTTNSNSPFPITITFDFGGGCPGPDAHVRKGKIIAKYSNRLLYPGAITTLEFADFSIDSIQIDNTTSYKIANTGTQDKLQFTIDINAKLSKPNGNYTEWYSHKVITRTDGSTTPTALDDILQIEGNASGKGKRNDLVVAWKAEITDPLIKRFACRWISKGTLKIGRENLSANSQWLGILDYGVGNCDNRATLTLNGVVYQITLH
ncbi:MAG TPA: hypothetical protein VK588_10545 [Chitinophagaceae bacterium]|nr:hypothetical protein [Chitinophagaceae bacterium]